MVDTWAVLVVLATRVDTIQIVGLGTTTEIEKRVFPSNWLLLGASRAKTLISYRLEERTLGGLLLGGLL